ncbi:adenosylcobalamin-dependent ribonucleoside-diphosphate reductase [endosymbiont GvMRE of Glomus versiforme]|uniref:adenosylcobalamin-dependent ribonucleoside-diphosphate reductase n=1 Tax=endosymbiont GvMRE of Glomus versiforme TaxID=2039283 RepID=UPI000ECCC5E6|nr:adenosylcobalamin-dependent ribonucleoside-diphosphate reductase [endosymbiont GvMRE of Glomus versiforme]RHZ36264.1 Vitamin B12-dependent ribonucleotide reductase [endosymbiont GvMRE of Glomus versiforme]
MNHENRAYPETYINRLNSLIDSRFSHLCSIQKNFRLSLQGISRLVMLDRYSQKDKELKSLQIGDVVLTTIKYDPKFPSKGIGKIVDKFTDNSIVFWVIEIEAEFENNIDPNLLYQKNGPRQIIKQTFEIEKPLELFWEQIAWRVGNAIAKPEENNDLKAKYSSEFEKQIREFKIIPAGRILYGAGSGSNVTFFNCYVMPYIKDSIKGIIGEHEAQVAEIMRRGGGVGSNGSTLRPKGFFAKNVQGKSSGAISWLNHLSSLTNLIEQGGSRRGAQMIMLADWHPDIVEFVVSKIQNPDVLLLLLKNTKDELIKREINNKLEKKGESYHVRDPDFLTGANISICISDKFMEAVKNDQEWDLVFPDLDNYSEKEQEIYDQEWHQIGDAYEWERKNKLPIKKCYTIRAQELWNLIISCATYSAEPGIFFLDRANYFTNARGYNQKVVATNPCGEQPLPPYSVCNLSAINLVSFVNKENSEILWNELKETVKICIRFQDNVIDTTYYFLKENTEQAKGERRIGMGVMGLHDFLIYAGYKYGSSEANLIVDKLFETICLTAYETSIELAKEKGPFPFLIDKDVFVENSGFIQTLPIDIQDKIKKHGLRNSHLLTVAPTGSTGTLVGVSTGLEPYFAFSHYRSGRLGKWIKVDYPIVNEWLKYHPEYNSDKLPNIFVSTMELTPEEHVNTQCIIQRWIDSSISKTVNAPKGYSIEQVKEIYKMLYEKGAKGGTVYVDGSRDFQVLSLEKNDNCFEDLKNEDKCHTCGEGKLVLANGCYTCNNCQLQDKCDI